MAAYATPAQLLQRYDARVIGDLVGDSGVRVARQELLDNAVLLACLADASGEIEASVLQAKRYTTADLAALTGNSLNYLVRITCTIAFGLLWERKPWSDDDDTGREEAQKRSRAALESLRKGKTIFDVEDVKEAGLPAIETPTIQRILSNNLAVDQARGRYYPNRRLPTSG
jgi:phage gp36-like protein